MKLRVPRFPKRQIGRPALAALLAALGACAGASLPGRPGGPSPADDPCLLTTSTPAADEASTRWVAALPGPVDPAHSPVPRSEAEGLVFAQLYETLVRIDCRGEAQPLLATAWEEEDGGRRWTFHLRPGARAWNGAAVRATDVTRSWQTTAPAGELAALTVLSDTTLRVELRSPAKAAFFARPELAVALPGTPGGWAVGTGPYRPEAASPRLASSSVLLRSGSGHEAVEFREMRGDPRNALDAGVDLLVTRDQEALDYAAASGGYHRAALPWDRVYVLVARVPAGYDARVGPSAAALQALARDAVRVQARAAAAAPADLAACAPPTTAPLDAGAGLRSSAAPAAPAPGVAGAGEILYPREDATAAALAQRLVALARAGTGAPWVHAALANGSARLTARGMSAGDFESALGSATAAGYVLPIRRTAASDPCDLLARARRRAPWLGPFELLPLVETRASAILREGVAGVTVDGAGTLLLPPAGATGTRP